jgi:hypothetical protein
MMCAWTGSQEEGEYEYISDYQGAENGKGEAHIEPAVLYQPLDEASALGSFGDEWRRILIEYGSRCEQYGGHWKGHKCVGARNHGGGSKSACEFVAGGGAGLVGAAVGTAAAGPVGGLAGGTVGTWLGGLVCG